MIRTQIQLTESQATALRHLSVARHQSIAELIRLSVDSFLEREVNAGQSARLKRAMSVAGRFASGSSDGSSEHDRHLADAFHHR